MTEEDRSANDVAHLRFNGGRYEESGFPLDGIDELEKYQRLVIAAAKKLWWDQNPDRERLPAHFDDRVRLRLTQVDEGSVVPIIERGSQLEVDDSPDLLDRAISYVDETFESIVKYLSLPEDLPDDMVRVVKVFGVSLRGKEAATFRWGTDEPIRYGSEERKALLESMVEVDEPVDGTLIGTIRMLDAAQEFILVDAFDRVIKGAFSQASLFDELRDALNFRDSADLLWLICRYVPDDEGRASRIEDVSAAGLFAKSENPWAPKLATIAAMPEGWLDGEGERIGLTALVAALELLDALSSNEMLSPSVFPDPEGGIRLEWLTPTSHTVIAIDDTPTFSGYHLNVATGEEMAADGLIGVNAAVDFVRPFAARRGVTNG